MPSRYIAEAMMNCVRACAIVFNCRHSSRAVKLKADYDLENPMSHSVSDPPLFARLAVILSSAFCASPSQKTGKPNSSRRRLFVFVLAVVLASLCFLVGAALYTDNHPILSSPADSPSSPTLSTVPALAAFSSYLQSMTQTIRESVPSLSTVTPSTQSGPSLSLVAESIAAVEAPILSSLNLNLLQHESGQTSSTGGTFSSVAGSPSRLSDSQSTVPAQPTAEAASARRVPDEVTRRRFLSYKPYGDVPLSSEDIDGFSYPVPLTPPWRAQPAQQGRDWCADCIDAVISWVNGSDPWYFSALNAHIQKVNKRGNLGFSTDSAGRQRFRDSDELLYNLRALTKHGKWLRYIHIVTNGEQVPVWLNTSHHRIHIVPHSMIYDNYATRDLPTFNIYSIKPHIHRIPYLAPKFIYFDDDQLLFRPSTASAFYDFDTETTNQFSQCDLQVTPVSTIEDNTEWTAIKNSAKLLYKNYQKKITEALCYPVHAPFVTHREVYREAMEEIWPTDAAYASMEKIRGPSGLETRLLLPYYQRLRDQRAFDPVYLISVVFDTNKDGFLDRAELESVRQYLAVSLPPGISLADLVASAIPPPPPSESADPSVPASPSSTSTPTSSSASRAWDPFASPNKGIPSAEFLRLIQSNVSSFASVVERAQAYWERTWQRVAFTKLDTVLAEFASNLEELLVDLQRAEDSPPQILGLNDMCLDEHVPPNILVVIRRFLDYHFPENSVFEADRQYAMRGSVAAQDAYSKKIGFTVQTQPSWSRLALQRYGQPKYVQPFLQ